MDTQLIVLTGPESSGKTTLACQLADYWNAPLVPEYARDYLAGKVGYVEEDLLRIARGQHKLEQALVQHAPEKIICDTDLLVIMIWSEVKYGHCAPWISDTFKDNLEREGLNRVYYLCDSNIPWQEDPLRENPDNRDELFELYLQKIKDFGLAYKVVEGEPGRRFQQVLDSVSSL